MDSNYIFIQATHKRIFKHPVIAISVGFGIGIGIGIGLGIGMGIGYGMCLWIAEAVTSSS
jgi:hypothetical protein